MKGIIHILLIFWSTGLFAQEGEKLVTISQNFNYQEIESGLDDIQNKSTEKIKYIWRTELERELINNYFEQIIELKKEVQDEENPFIHTIYTHKLKLIRTKDGKVAYYKIVQLKNIKSNGEWVPSEIALKENSNNKLNQLKKDFQATYSEPLIFEGLFETDIVFGSHCGIDGMDPEYRYAMNELVESKDTKTLTKWLKSTTVEIQLYAIDGILTLKRTGLSFDKEVLDLIDIISKKEGTAYTCSGCDHWNQPISEIVEEIKKENK